MILVIQYWSWMLLSLFFAWLSTRVKDKGVSILCSIISILIPSIIGGLREIGVGRDMLGYGIGTPMEVEASKSFWEFISDKKEIGYNTLCYVITKTLGNVHWCFFAYQLITVACFYVGAYKHRKTAPLPLLMFFFYCTFLPSSYNVIRQAMAASIIFMGLNNLESKRYIKFMMYIITAMMFHTSAFATIVIVLGFHMIITMKSRFRYIISYATVGLVAFVRPLAYALISAITLIPERYLVYVSNDPINVGFSRSAMILYIVEFITLTMYGKNGRRILGKANFDYYRVNILIIVLFYTVIMLFGRLIWYNQYVNLLVMASLPFMVKDKYTKLYMTIALILAYGLLWYNQCIILGANECWPYKSILKIY